MWTIVLWLQAASPATQPATLPATLAVEAPVRLLDETLFSFQVSRGTRTPAKRADDTQRALTAAIDEGSTRVLAEIGRDDATVRAGGRIIFVLTRDDAAAAGEQSFERFVEERRGRTEVFLRSAQRRVYWQSLTFAITLSVSIALLCYLLVRRLGHAGRAARRWLESDERRPVTPALDRMVADEKLRWIFVLGCLAGQWLAQLVVLYLALLAVLSLFEPTRPWRRTLTALVAQPLRQFAHRAAAGLPTLLLFVFVAVILQASFHAINTRFDRAARSPKQRMPFGLPREALGEGKLVAYAVILLATLLLLTPFLTGSGDHLFTRIGVLLLGLLGIASLPLLANVLVGLWATFAQHYEVGSMVRIGEQDSGRLVAYDLFYVHLYTEDGTDVRVPHLLTLIRPFRRLK